ncbi:alpha/beta fold hydrolase [Massilia sp. Leaf139]|uniref:alpha/beta fold hydrolase n=1 Tax=Massilia sp. Leaf139 TaxID=1736272 RepID=UPI0006FA6E3C|nr:alpha/beta hydrolase [Massilia sp. Leaf139]KQQ96925.1 alpha/beta hydrolase [Massilia sp. Leaf139]
MAPPSHSHVAAADRWVMHAHARMFVRTWTNRAAAPDLAPIVLLHDSLGSVDLWRDFPARLAAGTGRTVIAYDRLGFGKSDARADVLTPSFIGDEAATGFAALREQLGIRRFVVFGHSVGGAMAIHCAARYQDDCAALVTESAQVFAEQTTLAGVRAAKLQFADGEQFGRLEKYHGDKARWVLEAWTGTWLSERFSAWTLREVLPRVAAPTLAIHGGEDEYGSTRHPALIGEWCGAAVRVEILRDLHHLPHREQPDRVVDLVRDFLRTVP